MFLIGANVMTAEQSTSIIRVAFPRVVRVDEEVAYAEAVLPALSALSDPVYAGADDEFRRALQDSMLRQAS